jgi:tetratricopeptide (TPR) repeat protein
MTIEKPIAFVSSFYKEAQYDDRHDSPLWRLRQDFAALNEDESLRNILGIGKSRAVTWVAEKSTEPLDDPNRLAVVDRLVELLHDSELYICVLADSRRNDHDHGALIDFDGQPTNVSYFEIELYAAAMYSKPILPFVLKGFDPGPRLRLLLTILSWAFPDWRGLRPQTESEILRDVRERIQLHVLGSPRTASVRARLVQALYRHRAEAFGRGGDGGLLFLDGAHEARPLPEKERVESLIREYRSTPNYQRKLNRLWLAVRELMPVSYHPSKATSVMKEFFPYWDSVLGDWAAAASWHGWHGHLYAGTLEPLYSQYLIRTQGFASHAEFQPEVVLPPDGTIASAYYSIASLLGGAYYWKSLWRAGQHVRRAIEARNGPTDNLLAIRGSIRLRMGLWPWAISDFQEMLRIREKANAAPHKIADAFMHLGEAYALFAVSSKGRDLLQKAVNILEEYPNDPNLARARRKLAAAYRRALKHREAEEALRMAELDASRLAALDQLRK